MSISISKDAVKMSKAQAFELLTAIRSGHVATEVELDSAIMYFAPAAPRVAKTPIEWVAKACAKKDAREYMNDVLVSEGKAYGSDGHRVHFASVDLADGMYCATTLRKKDSEVDATFLRNMHRFEYMHSVNIEATEHLKSIPATPTMDGAKHIGRVHYGDLTRPYNATYVSDAECGLPCLSEINGMGMDHPCYIGTHDFGGFIIMARRG